MIYVLKQQDLWLMVFIRPFGWLLWNVRSFHWALTICLTVVVAGGWDIRHRDINYNTFTGGSMNPCLCNRTGRICRCHQAHTCLLAQEGLICPRTSSSCLVWRVAELSFFNLVFEIPWLSYPTLYQNVMGVLQIGQTSISYIVNKLSIYTCLPLPLANMPMGLVLSQAHLQLWSFLSFSPLYRIGSRKKVWKGPQTPKLE